MSNRCGSFDAGQGNNDSPVTEGHRSEPDGKVDTECRQIGNRRAAIADDQLFPVAVTTLGSPLTGDAMSPLRNLRHHIVRCVLMTAQMPSIADMFHGIVGKGAGITNMESFADRQPSIADPCGGGGFL